MRPGVAGVLVAALSASAYADNMVWGTTNRGELLEIDLDAEAVTKVGESAGFGWTDLAVHPGTADLYAVQRNASGINTTVSFSFERVDPNTGTVLEDLGSLNRRWVGDIAFAADGTLYGNWWDGVCAASCIGSGRLIEIDPADASVTEASNLFGNNLQNGGLAVDPATGQLWGIESLFSGQPQIFQIDPNTGLGSNIVRLGLNGSPIDFGFDSLAITPDGTFIASRGGPTRGLYRITPSADPISGLAEVELILLTLDPSITAGINGLAIGPGPVEDQQTGLFNTGFQEVAPTVHEFAGGVLNVTTQIHLVSGDASVTQATLDMKAADWEMEIEDLWNGSPFMFEDEHGFRYPVAFNVIFVDDGNDPLVTTVTVHPTTPAGGINTLNWAVDQAQYTAAHEYGHLALGLLDAYTGAIPAPVPPPPPDGIDNGALMGVLVPVLRSWYFDNLVDYFAGQGITMIVSGDPDPSMAGDLPDEGAHVFSGDQFFTFIPEPSAIGLLALGLLAVARRRRRS